MDISKFKDVILNVFKTHSSLLVPVVIGLVGGLLFIILAVLMSSKLKKQIAEESISKGGRQIASLSSNAVARGQWKEEQKYQDKHREDANDIELLAKQSTQRELLSYEIFPAPKDDSMSLYQEFGQQFRSAVDKLMARINAGGCPTQAELEKSLQSSLGSRSPSGSGEFMRGSLERPYGGSYGGQYGEPYGRLGGARTEIIEALCRARAESAFIYANPSDLSGYEFWGKYEHPGMEEAVKDCWCYQLAYWIIEDVIDTIDAMNSGSNSVFTSPAKRLLGVWFTPISEFAMGAGMPSVSGRPASRYTGRGAVTSAKPSYVRSIREGLTDPWTGRICNDDIDVMHFNVAVVVSAKSVLPFMQQLCSAKQHEFRGWDGKGQEQIFKHNQITILESEIGLVARGGGEYEGSRGIPAYGGGSGVYGYENRGIHNLYRYGEDAVVELELICEYIFNKKGYDEIEPESVKKEESETTGSGL